MEESIDIRMVTITDFHATDRNNSGTSACHNYYTVVWIENGNISMTVDNILISVSGTGLLFICKNRIWSISEAKGSRGYVIQFSTEFFCRKAADVRLLQRSVVFDVMRFIDIPTQEIEAVTNIISFLHNEYIARKEFCHEIIRQQLSTLMLLSERIINRRNMDNYLQQEEYKRTRIFKRLVEEHYVDLKSVSKYAELMCISHKSLIACVSKTTGTMPKQLLNERIMLEAKRLLVYCSWSVKEISITGSVGKSSYFSNR